MPKETRADLVRQRDALAERCGQMATLLLTALGHTPDSLEQLPSYEVLIQQVIALRIDNERLQVLSLAAKGDRTDPLAAFRERANAFKRKPG